MSSQYDRYRSADAPLPGETWACIEATIIN
jgi:hypothetical protein